MGAAVTTDAPMVIEEHPLFPEWLAAFEHLVRAQERLKTAGSNEPNVLDL
jgi:hypothetical protein